MSDFSYDTNTDEDQAITRSFGGINSVGGAASLILAGPDGQGIYGELFTFTRIGDDAAREHLQRQRPSGRAGLRESGSLWDTDHYDVSCILPAGQTTLKVENTLTDDCIGVGATVLQVSQRAP